AQIEARMASNLIGGAMLEVVQQTFVRADTGAEVHVEVTSSPCVFEGRIAILSIGRDVTARVAATRTADESVRSVELGRRKFEAVLAALPVGVWIADAAGRLEQTNPAAARIWGGAAPLVAGLSDYGVYVASWPDTGRTVTPGEWALARTVESGETIVAEAVDIQRFDGTAGHVLNSSAPIFDDSGKQIGGVAVLLDVTAAHAAERERERLIGALEFERRRLGVLLENAPACIAVMRGKDHVFEFINTAYDVATGCRHPVGKSVREAFPEVNGQGFVELLDRVLETGEPFVANGMPLMLSRSPGAPPEQCYVNFVYQPITEEDGTRTGVFAHGVDVTDAVRAQQRLRAQFEGVPMPTYVWQRASTGSTRDFELVDFNAAALAVSSGGIAERRGVMATAHFAETPGLLEDLARCLDEGATIRREIDWRPSVIGETRRLHFTFAPVLPDLVIVHTEDHTERLSLEVQLRQAQKIEAVGRLAGGVAHDFNNLLSVILSYTHLAMDDLKEGDPLRDDLGEVRAAGQRATELTRQLLAFSRQQVLQPRVIELPVVVAGMRSMLGRLLGEDVELSILPMEAVGRVLADPGQIEQVVMNLAVNARDAMPDGGRLTIEVSNVELDEAYVGAHLGAKAGHYVLLTVSDTGTGMDAYTQTRIFEPFFTTKPKDKGTGLGLSMVFGIVKQSDGYMTVDSELGHGTAFTIYLPRTDRAIDVARPSSTDPVRGGNETILLVEDEDQVRMVASEILRRKGYNVLDAANGGEALLVAMEHPTAIHLMITDMVMPRMSGRKLVEHIAPARPDMKVLFSSGYTDDAILKHGVSDAAVAFLQKPFSPEALLRKVREVLDGG
ncbi:MAG: PAS domain-containing protein, partial [Polyangia bacterium]